MWATREVGAQVHTIAYAAAESGVAWHTVMDAVRYWGTALIEDPVRVDDTEALGGDETKFLAAQGPAADPVAFSGMSPEATVGDRCDRGPSWP